IYRYLTYKSLFNVDKPEPDISQWICYIDSLKYPENDTTRTFNRYLCRMYYFPLYYKFLANVSSVIAHFLSIPIILRKSGYSTYTKAKKEINGAVLIKAKNVDYVDILPKDIEISYGKISIINRPGRNNWLLTNDAKVMLLNAIKTHPLYFHLNQLIFRELCVYSFIIEYYAPKAIIVYVNERNVVAPMISDLCEKRGIDFVTFMHGDYQLQLLHAYMRFTRFYVWDDHYANMFINDLRCAPDQFILYKPDKLKGICKPRESDGSYEYFATYYFGAETITRIQKVAEAFDIMKKRGKKLKIRPHPRRSNIPALYEAFSEYFIEDTKLVSLSESVENSLYIIALNSTVLSEAYYSGKKIVIDDISDVEKFTNLVNRKFILLNKPHILFSDLLFNE
ncbi:MAG: hypothetical protein V1903_04065, partial [Bacteroidota bacterium]